ncbi:N-methyl-L-tryptophan oxidase [Saliphagus sp. LR7]|uniref:N-methyl-L-tryptophan oxidase n=1 Tax=Saliphagus sp. LR7 TaxID=2282654 RepID=UPI000DF7E25B|nr:N-methyl-L-tryptophan oxidase [Saliphagus sp. LR7]
MTPDRYDAIVVGVGDAGAAAVAHLADRGVDVLGLERFDIPHGYGSSPEPGAIRLAAGEEDVPLYERAVDLWEELGVERGERLRYRGGALDVGLESELEELAASLASHDVAHERLSGATLTERYPAYRLPDDESGDGEEYAAIYQPDGGLLRPDRAIVAHVERAHDAGATIRARERVTDWDRVGDDVRVRTNRDEYRADELVVTAGPWTGGIVEDLEDVLRPERRVRTWLQPDSPAAFAPERFPPFAFRTDEGRYYGGPVLGVPGFSFGRRHHRGETADPTHLEREPMPQDERVLRRFADRYFPGGTGPTMGLRTSLATATPDDRFLVGTLPDDDRVTVAAGLSGGEAPLASVVGEIVADLVTEGETDHGIEPFALDRFPAPNA